MLTGAIEVYANHAVVIVGSTAWPEVDFGGGSAGADDRHVAIRTRGQAAHTRVSIWQNTMPLVGHLVFDGELDLDDYTICVGDIERIGRWTQRIDQTGVQQVIVRVDDPGNASRVKCRPGDQRRRRRAGASNERGSGTFQSSHLRAGKHRPAERARSCA